MWSKRVYLIEDSLFEQKQYILSKIHVVYLRNRKKKKEEMIRWDREKLKTRSKELSDKIEEHLLERELISTEERWNRLKKVVKTAAVDTIGLEMGSDTETTGNDRDATWDGRKEKMETLEHVLWD